MVENNFVHILLFFPLFVMIDCSVAVLWNPVSCCICW